MDNNDDNLEATSENFDELAAKAETGELTEASLQQKLNEYSAALKQEYETKTAASPENLEEFTRDFFKKNVHSMAAQVVWLANNAESESVQLSACKYGIGLAFAQSEEDGDPIKNLLKELTGASKKKAAASN